MRTKIVEQQGRVGRGELVPTGPNRLLYPTLSASEYGPPATICL